MHRLRSAAAVVSLTFAAGASAHVSLEPRTATAGSYQKLVFRVGHGCDTSATTAITVSIPDGLGEAKAMPKPGWTLSGSGREISWKGGVLLDSQFDEFSLLIKLPGTAGKQLFKVVQLCEKGRAEWVEAPGVAGKFPAPVLEIVGGGAVQPAMPAGHQH